MQHVSNPVAIAELRRRSHLIRNRPEIETAKKAYWRYCRGWCTTDQMAESVNDQIQQLVDRYSDMRKVKRPLRDYMLATICEYETAFRIVSGAVRRQDWRRAIRNLSRAWGHLSKLERAIPVIEEVSNVTSILKEIHRIAGDVVMKSSTTLQSVFRLRRMTKQYLKEGEVRRASLISELVRQELSAAVATEAGGQVASSLASRVADLNILVRRLNDEFPDQNIDQHYHDRICGATRLLDSSFRGFGRNLVEELERELAGAFLYARETTPGVGNVRDGASVQVEMTDHGIIERDKPWDTLRERRLLRRLGETSSTFEEINCRLKCLGETKRVQA